MLPVLIVGGLAYVISYWVCSTGTPVWRAIAGFLIAFFVGWVGGAGIAIFLLTTFFDADAAVTTFSLLKNGIAWALFGSGYGVYRGRKKLKTTNTANAPLQSATPTTTSPEPTGNDAYAAALAEIDEGQLDKGVWARSFAESGGDESKAKASYIRARAASIKDAAVWVDTQSLGAEDAGIKATDDGQAASLSPVPVTKSLTTSTYEIGVWVILVLAFIAWWQYMEYTKRQTVAASAVQAPVSQFDSSEFEPVPIQPQDQQSFSVSLEKAVAAIESEIGSAYAYSMLPTIADIESRYPVFRTEAGQVESHRLKIRIDEKLAGFARPAPQSRAQTNQITPKPGFSPKVQADLIAIAARAVRDYPYLDTPDGKVVQDKIIKRRDELIEQGVYPSIALTQAVNYYAPGNAPGPVKEKKIAPVEEKHNEFMPGCSWVTPQKWSCK